MLQRGIPTSNPLTYSRLVTILCADRLNISLIIRPCQTNKNILERWMIPMKKTIKLMDLDCSHCADKIQNAVQKFLLLSKKPMTKKQPRTAYLMFRR